MLLLLRDARILCPRDEPDGGVDPVDLKVVLEGHGEAVQRTEGSAGTREVVVRLGGGQEGLVEEDLG
jgi:hypothetical protein